MRAVAATAEDPPGAWLHGSSSGGDLPRGGQQRCGKGDGGEHLPSPSTWTLRGLPVHLPPSFHLTPSSLSLVSVPWDMETGQETGQENNNLEGD